MRWLENEGVAASVRRLHLRRLRAGVGAVVVVEGNVAGRVANVLHADLA